MTFGCHPLPKMPDSFDPRPSAQPQCQPSQLASVSTLPKTKPAAPTEAKYGRTFDPWNSSATGHQRAENRHPQGWRESRTRKLRSQLLAGHTGGARIIDSVGRGSEQYDEGNKVFIPKEVKARAEMSVFDMLKTPGRMREQSFGSAADGVAVDISTDDTELPAKEVVLSKDITQSTTEPAEGRPRSRGGIFSGLVIYVNGSTHPLISDHKLKRLLAEHGAHMSIHLGRRQVTHVIVGRPIGSAGGFDGSSGKGAGLGAGGGLAGIKIEKEIALMRGCSVKYIGVEWYAPNSSRHSSIGKEDL
jgi:hypothetical protein